MHANHHGRITYISDRPTRNAEQEVKSKVPRTALSEEWNSLCTSFHRRARQERIYAKGQSLPPSVHLHWLNPPLKFVFGCKLRATELMNHL